jgi:hypothetical protein
VKLVNTLLLLVAAVVVLIIIHQQEVLVVEVLVDYGLELHQSEHHKHTQ